MKVKQGICVIKNKVGGGVSRTAQWVKALLAKPGNLNSVSETHMIEELQQVVS